MVRAVLRAMFRSAKPPGPLFRGVIGPGRAVQPYLIALVVAGGTAWFGALNLSHGYRMAPAVSLALAVAQAAPLLLAVNRPLASWWLITAAQAAAWPFQLSALHTHGQAGWPWPAAAFVSQAPVLVALTVHERVATLLAVWTTLNAAGLGLAEIRPQHDDGSAEAMAILSALILFVGWAVRERYRANRRLYEHLLAAQRERTRVASLEERARIARELHDVVAHHMSVITVQADSAPFRVADLPSGAAAEFQQIATTARAALHETRRLLGALRGTDPAAAELAPQPGLDRLPELVAGAANAGAATELRVADPLGTLAALSPGIQLTAFRIVQESLANVVRHAPGATARVEITHTDGGLAVEVTNSAGAPRRAAVPVGPRTAADGHGLIGMRERIRLADGTFHAGPTAAGGFRVAAWIPAAGDGGRTAAAADGDEDRQNA